MESMGSDNGSESQEGEQPMPPGVASMALVEHREEVDPCLGMEFESAEDAWGFYNEYACRVGFSTRISVYQRSRKDGSITARQFVCSKEGFRTPRRNRDEGGGGEMRPRRIRAVTRVGCKAMIRVKKQENGRWRVSKLEMAHNHDLVSPSRAHCNRSRRLLSESGRSQLGFRGARGLGPDNARLKQGLLTYHGVSEQQSSGGGMGMEIVDCLKRMQVEESGFFLAMQEGDGNGDELKGNVFWADERCRMAYKCFGDVVRFDMSCKKSQYQVPFACFTGLNHHRQPVLFGCALLVDDSEPSLLWLFKALLLAMSGCQPTSVVLEQDWSVEAAVRQVFPNARCRFCKWHLMEEGRDRLSHVFHAHMSFEEELYQCVDVETVDEFEFYWEILLSRHDLGGNDWLHSVYGYRHLWVPAYSRSTFFAEFAPSRKCECRTSLFEGFVTAETNSQVFIQQYEKALDCRYEKEVKAEFDSTYTLHVLKTPSPLEKQASELYTSKIFKKFQEEVVQSIDYTVNKLNEEGDTAIYQVVKLEEEHKLYKVVFNAPQIRASCCCQMFEYSGILCRHILRVFSEANILMLPSHYILKRWTRNAKNEGENDRSDGCIADEINAESQGNAMDVQQSLTWRYNSLCREAIKFAEDGATCPEIYNIAMCALQEAVKKVSTAKQKVGEAEKGGSVFDGRGVQASSGIELQDASNMITVGSDKVGLVTYFSSLSEAMKAAVPQQVIQTQPLQESQLSQPTCNFLMVAPTLPGEPVSSGLLSAVAPLALQTNGSFGGNKPVMVNLSSGSISKEDSKHEKATSQPSPGCNAMQIGQTGTTQVISGNATGAGSSETQLMAVPMTFFVPMISNSSTSCSVAVTNTNVALISPMPIPVDATRSCPSQALNLSRLTPPLVAIQKGTQPTVPEAHTNSVRATAIAAGARIASPTAAASIIKAIQAKTPIHIKARESSPARSTSPRDLGSPVPKPSALTTDTTMVQNAPVCSDMPMDAYNELMNEGLNADKAARASDSPGMDFTDSSNDEEMTY